MKYSVLELNIIQFNVFIFVSLEYTKPLTEGKRAKKYTQSFNCSPQVKVLCVFCLVILVSR